MVAPLTRKKPTWEFGLLNILKDLKWNNIDFDMLYIWFYYHSTSTFTIFCTVQEVNLQHFLGRLVLFTYCYDKDRQSSHNAAICRIWRHSLFYAKFINLSYIENLNWHFFTLFSFLPVSRGCYFKRSWHARGMVRKLLLLLRFFMLLSPGSRFFSH